MSAPDKYRIEIIPTPQFIPEQRKSDETTSELLHD